MDGGLDQAFLTEPAPPRQSVNPPRILIIGAGSRGNAYARAIAESTNGMVVAVAEPIAFKRKELGRRYIWGTDPPTEAQEFNGWTEFLFWETQRRQRQERGELVPDGVDGVLVCTLDEMHAEIITSLAPLQLHIMSEKPLATTLSDCLDIYSALAPSNDDGHRKSSAVFAIGHVLRYSQHNMLLRKLLLEDNVIGDVISIEHTEPVGWWHFSHSYVRGNWRKESTTAPSLLTKSCHDIDLLLWLLCSPPPGSKGPPHVPTSVSSTGSLKYFKQTRKPFSAGGATNCFSCAAEPSCQYSAKRIYHSQFLKGNYGWPVKIVVPEIEDAVSSKGHGAAEQLLFERLQEDYDAKTPQKDIDGRPWFGRCVYEAENDVCDDQVVIMTWDDDPWIDDSDSAKSQETHHQQFQQRGLAGRGAKTAIFHMVAFTEKICERRSRIYGSRGEIEADSQTITVHDFPSGHSKKYHPHQSGGGHGGGDDGLMRQFVSAIDAVKNHGESVMDAQMQYIGCPLDEMIQSHAMVFAAEEARKTNSIINWAEWCQTNIEAGLLKRRNITT